MSTVVNQSAGCTSRTCTWDAGGQRQVRSEFRESVREHFRPIDMILVTGDLTFSAQPKESKLFDEFLDELLGWLREAGQEADPLVIPVPGNHDLVHLDDLKVAPFYNLEHFWNTPEHQFIQSLCKTLWEARKAAYCR